LYLLNKKTTKQFLVSVTHNIFHFYLDIFLSIDNHHRPSLHNSKTGVCGANSIHAPDSRFWKDDLMLVNCPKHAKIKK